MLTALRAALFPKRNPEGAAAEASALSGLSERRLAGKAGPRSRRLADWAEAPSTAIRGLPRFAFRNLPMPPRGVKQHSHLLFASFDDFSRPRMDVPRICQDPSLVSPA